ncbi:glycerophosphodiester phosphodiesterase family protein [Corynebacterium sp.]|uniref:glycerophosphodiester phosphodiesterase family protein n=1 Tax=Corynebacterium sp. TaxID=1720 RepID=UPI0026DB5374|nr:glycerophosphodiester phosphodiesterase family protein [Corynebacterium sp.]MDO5077239.1 glycerophosphodiester phosphodiesterase family protein [Corynebacterium sp.]
MQKLNSPRISQLKLPVGLASDIWLYLRYQLLTKTLLSLIVFPLFQFLSVALIRITGRETISSGDFKSVLFSPIGAGMLLVTLVFLGVFIVVDIAAFILAEDMRLRGEPRPNARQLLLITLRAIPRFWHPATLLLILYLGIVVPLAGVGPALSQLSWLQIPNFVLDVIKNNTLYYTLYAVALVILAVVAVLFSHTIQIMFVDRVTPWQGLRKSAAFVRANWRSVLTMVLVVSLVLAAVVLAVVLVFSLIPLAGAALFPQGQFATRFALLLAMLNIGGVVALLLFLAAPLQLRNFTRLYAWSNAPGTLGEDVIAQDRRARKPLALAAVVSVLGVVALAGYLASDFDAVFRNDRNIEVVAHRGGGDLDAENSLEGIQAAIDKGIDWTEIDIQRTKDGHYVLNHDETFQRVGGVNAAAPDVTLAEIQEISLQNLFTEGAPARPVATIDQVMDVADGNIGIFLELKGKTADRAMVDDMARMIKQRGMEDSVVLLSLDYELISYAEEKYPELLTGYLYYFVVGDSTTLKADYLIMEEGVASKATVESLHKAGKKAVVWTVNTPESISRFVGSNVDGIITDYPQQVQQGQQDYAKRSDFERIFDEVFGG